MSSSSPTIGWCSRLTPVRWKRTLCAAQRTRNSSLRVESSLLATKVFFPMSDDPADHPVGDVYVQTRCGGSGRGGGYMVTTYSAWLAAEWDFGGGLVASSRLVAAPAGVDQAFSAADAYGDTVFNAGSQAYLSVPLPGA